MKIVRLFCLFLLVSACTSDPKKPGNPIEPEHSPVEQKNISFEAPTNGSSYAIGDEITGSIRSDEVADSIQISIDGKVAQTLYGTSDFTLSTEEFTTGRKGLRAKAFYGDGSNAIKSILIQVKARSAPVKKGYKLIKQYPHPEDHYTQGFEVHDDVIFEGTGLNGKSLITRYKLGSTQLEKTNALPYKYFGEGITLLGENLYQLTWRSHIGFVYNAESFQKTREFQYPVEGWGLCNNGKELIMSDGTGTLYFLDPGSLVEIRRMEVFDDQKAANQLNELEYLDGKIYANVYLDDLILIIDEKTGEVLEEIDMSGLLNPLSVKKEIDVLNGIAYHKKTGNFLVTGKLWPYIFEVAFE